MSVDGKRELRFDLLDVSAGHPRRPPCMLNKKLLNDAAASCSEVTDMINDLLNIHPLTSQHLRLTEQLLHRRGGFLCVRRRCSHLTRLSMCLTACFSSINYKHKHMDLNNNLQQIKPGRQMRDYSQMISLNIKYSLWTGLNWITCRLEGICKAPY